MNRLQDLCFPQQNETQKVPIERNFDISALQANTEYQQSLLKCSAPTVILRKEQDWVTPSVIVKNYWELISKNKVSLLQTFIPKVTFNLFLQFRKSLPSHGEQWCWPWTPIHMAYFCGSVKSIMFLGVGVHTKNHRRLTKKSTIPGAVFDLPTACKSDPITVKDRVKFGRRSLMSLNRHQFHQGGPAQL